jgi:hypothetical protein
MEKKRKLEKALNFGIHRIPKRYFIVVFAAMMVGSLMIGLTNNPQEDENDPWDLTQYRWVEGEVRKENVEYRLMSGETVLYMDDLSNKHREAIREEKLVFTNDTFDNIVYREIPEMPLDFYKKRGMFWEHYITDPSRIGYEYYIQPEWFSNGERCLDSMHIAKREGWVPGFASVFISDISMKGKPGETLRTIFWVRSACFSELYQGVQMQAQFPNNAAYGGKTWENPVNSDGYFEVSFAPDLFILPPSYKLVPLVVSEEPWKAYWIPTFDKNYTIPVTIEIKIAEDTPAGEYIVGASPVPPSKEFSEDMYNQYLNMYTPTGSNLPIGIGRPYLQVFLTVE